MKHVFVQALLPEDLHTELKHLAIDKGLAIKAVIKLAIINYLKEGDYNGKRKETD